MITIDHDIKFIRVLGARANHPAVLALVDGNRVRWEDKVWGCTCLTELDEYECDHITVVRSMLDPRVENGTPRRGIIL